jgi:IS605 OrfB family transposase
MILTYQTRIPFAHPALDAYGELYGRVERSLFAAIHAGRPMNELKRDFLKQFGITARQFNAIRITLEGKIASIAERLPDLKAEAEARIKKAEKVLAKLRDPAKIHQKKRRIATMRARLAALDPGICFGSRKLFRAQFDLAANGYANLDEWRAAWHDARSNQFFFVGSKDEKAGNQTCQAVLAQDGSLDLVLRMPDAMGKRITLTGLRFAYGQQQIEAARHTAISYRFLRDAKGWRVFVSLDVAGPPTVSHALLGAVGVDLNADHLAVAETDRFGNLIDHQRIDVVIYGKTSDQSKALIGDAAVAIARRAADAHKPVVVEKLDFAKRKAELESVDRKHARMLSSFAYGRTLTAIKAACHRVGVEVVEVNPAYTSVIGAVNYAQIKGISVHLAAAFAIARRGLRMSESPTVLQALAPVGNGGHVTFALPVRNRARHVWSHWSKIRTSLRAAHVAHFRSGQPAPSQTVTPALGSIWTSTVRIRGANRRQNCSADVTEDIRY